MQRRIYAAGAGWSASVVLSRGDFGTGRIESIV